MFQQVSDIKISTEWGPEMCFECVQMDAVPYVFE